MLLNVRIVFSVLSSSSLMSSSYSSFSSLVSYRIPLQTTVFYRTPYPFQNMFLAIINDTYVEVKAELARQPDDFQVASFVSKVSLEGKTTVSLPPSLSHGIDSFVPFDSLRRFPIWRVISTSMHGRLHSEGERRKERRRERGE